MPVYVYRNLNTGETFELEQRISESALTEHPQTGDPVKRLIQPVGIAFKGSGFYVNDSRKSSEGASKPKKDADAKSDKAEAGSDSKSSDTKTPDSKSESKTETKSEPKTEKKSEVKGSSKA
ncbi:hypothetical protein BH24DEI2_BH24DEI2_05290 [soil metagenome]